MTDSLLTCPGCGCYKQKSCDSTIGIPIPNTYQCTTCDEIYKVNKGGNMIVLYEGKKHG